MLREVGGAESEKSAGLLFTVILTVVLTGLDMVVAPVLSVALAVKM